MACQLWRQCTVHLSPAQWTSQQTPHQYCYRFTEVVTTHNGAQTTAPPGRIIVVKKEIFCSFSEEMWMFFQKKQSLLWWNRAALANIGLHFLQKQTKPKVCMKYRIHPSNCYLPCYWALPKEHCFQLCNFYWLSPLWRIHCSLCDVCPNDSDHMHMEMGHVCTFKLLLNKLVIFLNKD